MLNKYHLLNLCVWQHQWWNAAPYTNNYTARLIQN